MLENKHVYVIDDEEIIRNSSVFFLKSAGFISVSFPSGQSFLDGIDDREPGCVMLDIRMPDMDGLQFIKAVGPKISSFPILVITGHGDVGTAVGALKLGASDFLEKPFEEDVLLDTLQAMFEALEIPASGGEKTSPADPRIGKLTRREQDVLHGLMAGWSNKELAFRLDLSVRTVEMHRSRMMDRLGARTLSEALTLAFQSGVKPGEPQNKRLII